MIKSILAVIGLLGCVWVAEVVGSRAIATPGTKPDVIVLSAKNTLSLNQTVTEESMAQLESDLIKMSLKLAPTGDIYLVMNTPGGDVHAGTKFIDIMKSIPQKIHTLTIFSASMGFHIVQNSTGDRFILPSGTLMSHRAKGGMEGEFGGSIQVRLSWIANTLTRLDQICADRMGLRLPDYQQLIRDEYWVEGQNSVDQHAADKLVVARCDASLMGEDKVTIQTMFGAATITTSHCPLITAPTMIEAKEQSVKDFFNSWYTNPVSFVETYIMTSRYKEFLR